MLLISNDAYRYDVDSDGLSAFEYASHQTMLDILNLILTNLTAIEENTIRNEKQPNMRNNKDLSLILSIIFYQISLFYYFSHILLVTRKGETYLIVIVNKDYIDYSGIIPG
jgi:hypothetical protein